MTAGGTGAYHSDKYFEVGGTSFDLLILRPARKSTNWSLLLWRAGLFWSGRLYVLDQNNVGLFETAPGLIVGDHEIRTAGHGRAKLNGIGGF